MLPDRPRFGEYKHRIHLSAVFRKTLVADFVKFEQAPEHPEAVFNLAEVHLR
jgi:hypothetical protein